MKIQLLLCYCCCVFLLACTADPGAEPTAVPAATTPATGKAQPDNGVEIRDEGLVATWFAPPTAGPHAGLLVLGGSEGGKQMSSASAAGLHAQGYATLALAYFGEAGLPPQLQAVPLEYFVRALDWIARQPGVDPARIGVVGVSKGAEAALLLASRDRRVRAVVAATPTDHAWQSIDWNGWSDTPSWTEAGAPVPYLRYAVFDPAAGLRAMYDRSIAEAPPALREAARIPVERSAAAFLLIAGQLDTLWGAAEASQRIATSLQAVGHVQPVQVLSYPDAGHVVFIGRSISADDTSLERILPMGGSRAGVVAAINDAWPKTLDFLARQLTADGATAR